jgi:hypothetical protein
MGSRRQPKSTGPKSRGFSKVNPLSLGNKSPIDHDRVRAIATPSFTTLHPRAPNDRLRNPRNAFAMTAARFLAILGISALAYAGCRGRPSNPFTGGLTSHVRDLSHQILVPLESHQAPSTESATNAIATLNAQINTYAGTPDYNRSRRALALLSAALQERDSFIKQALTKAPENVLDKVPGQWHDAWHREKTVDVSGLNRQIRSSYWAGVALAQWRGRCTYYRTAIDTCLNGP